MYSIHQSCQIPTLANIYYGIFGYKESGFFIDIGACDGISYSNTYGLAQIGWHGILAEPLIRDYEKCKTIYEYYNNIQVVNFAVSNYIGKGVLYTGDVPHVCSTMSLEFKNLLENTEYGKNYYGKEQEVEVITLDHLLKTCTQLFPSMQLDILSIDTEGTELLVLEKFDIRFWKPNLVIVEAHELHKGSDRPITYPGINKYFSDNGYIRVYSDEINNIYLEKI